VLTVVCETPGTLKAVNPFLVRRVADIAQDHAQKKQRRFAPIVALAGQQCAVRRQLLSTGGGLLEHRHGRPGADLDRVDGKTRTFELGLSSGTLIDQTRRHLWTEH
jgi:hypothetical protein